MMRTQALLMLSLSGALACTGAARAQDMERTASPERPASQSASRPARNDSAAVMSPPLYELNRLIEASQYAEAYELSLQGLEDWEGDTDFDFLYGLAALESGHPLESVYAFERVATTASSAIVRERARLELARAYFLTHNLVASEELFRQVLETDPPQNVQDNIQAFLGLIETRQQSQRNRNHWTLATDFGHDDNINSATTSAFIDTPLIGSIELSPEGRKTADEFADYTVGFRHERPMTRNRGVELNINLNRRDNLSTDQFDLDILHAEAAYVHGGGTDRFRYGLRGQKVNLDGGSFQDSLGLNGSWQHAWGNGWFHSLSASASAIRYATNSNGPRNDLRDVNQILMSGVLSRVGEEFTNSLSIYYGDEDPIHDDGGHNGRGFFGVAHSLRWQLNDSHMPYLRLSAQKARHDETHPVFFTAKRDDSTYSASLGWLWQYSKRFNLTSEAQYTRAKSNIPLFEYTRSRYQVGLRYEF